MTDRNRTVIGYQPLPSPVRAPVAACASGFTLFDVLVVIAAASLFMVMFAVSEPLIQNQQRAALTVARTGNLLNAAYIYQKLNNQNWPDSEDLQLVHPASAQGDYVNNFGYEYVFDEEGLNFAVYQFVPKVWAGFIVNRLERTERLSLAEAAAVDALSDSDALAALDAGDFVVLKSVMDIYGNMHLAFKRREFRSSLFRKNQRNDPPSGETIAEIPKPYCPDSRSPTIFFTVRGACSLYPDQHYNSDVRDAYEDNEELPWNEAYLYYQTSAFRFRLEDPGGPQDPWQIYVESLEKWYQEVPNPVPDGEGGVTIETSYETRENWSASHELCGWDSNNNRLENENINNDNDDNNDRFLRQSGNYDDLLYVDAWVSCQ
ncbi:MAG: hypothetical protein R3208_10645 [Ketobacteraceae bacterium]|nr:hypothetical protein [Ketobacteraceae bacterium]